MQALVALDEALLAALGNNRQASWAPQYTYTWRPATTNLLAAHHAKGSIVRFETPDYDYFTDRKDVSGLEATATSDRDIRPARRA